jgi:hypothetical protein
MDDEYNRGNTNLGHLTDRMIDERLLQSGYYNAEFFKVERY